jgi:metallophosphoesterase superfamily enzyme
VVTAYELGWSALKNGELLAAAELQGFQVLVTTDTHLKYQQNLASRGSGMGDSLTLSC